ncbi:helix-turn-helix domain-containing protein [Planctomycetota bacterium]
MKQSNKKNLELMRKGADNWSGPKALGSESCSICKDLLICMERFFDIIETKRKPNSSDWLTVDDISKELRISKSIVYRLIRQGELKAINIVTNNNGTAAKGHYRIERSALNKYIEAKRVKPFPSQAVRASHSRRYPNVKNHLGL